jgi:hypothetical protein
MSTNNFNITSNNKTLTTEQLNSNTNLITAQKDKQRKKLDNAKKAIDDQASYLKDQSETNSRENKAKLAGILAPVIASFFTSEVIINSSIKTLLRSTKKKLVDKGNVSAGEYSITFTPTVAGDYLEHKRNFDKKISNMKNIVKILKTTITLLQNTIRVLNLGLSLTRTFIAIKTKLLNVQLTATSIDFASPAPAKPAAATQFPNIIKKLKKLEKAEKDLELAQSMLLAATAFLPILLATLANIQNKLNQLSFVIVAPNLPSGNISSDSATGIIQNVAPSEEDYISELGKSYKLKLVTLPNNFRQYQALDSFSGLKITQTAPSKTKSNGDLLNEIKQILG